MYYHSRYLYYRNFELCSGTSSLAPRPMLGDYLDHSPTTAQGLCRWLLDLCLGTASITLRPRLRDFVARSSTYARGLPRPLFDHSLGISRLNYMQLTTRIQLGYFFSFRPCYKAHTSPYSKLGDYIHGLLFLVAGANLIIFVQWISTRLHASGAAIKSRHVAIGGNVHALASSPHVHVHAR